MCRKTKKIISAALAAVMMLMVLSVSAFAAAEIRVDGFSNCKAVGDYNVNSMKLTGPTGGSEDPNTLGVLLKFGGEASESEFWNNSDAYLEYEIRLISDTVAITQTPAFTKGWGWVDAPNYGTPLYNEWASFSIPLSHYYDNGFNKKAPLNVIIQVLRDAGDANDIEFEIRNVKFVGVDSSATVTTAATTTTVATTTTAETTTTAAPAESEPEEVTPVTEEVAPAETAEEAAPAETAEESQPEETTKATTTTPAPEEDEPEESKPEEDKAEQTTAATTKPATYATTIATGADSGDVVGTIIIIVVVAVVIVAAAVVGYLIYRKKKYY